jgi:hypothetical protein
MLVQVSKRVGCHKPAARNLRASCLRRQSANKPVMLYRESPASYRHVFAVMSLPLCLERQRRSLLQPKVGDNVVYLVYFIFEYTTSTGLPIPQ